MKFVVNIRSGLPFDEYVGRGSPFGNKYTHLPLDETQAEVQVATRQEAVERFEDDLLADPELMARVRRDLRGKVLGCYCDEPLPCHARVLAHYANAP